jgi:signal peptidase II
MMRLPTENFRSPAALARFLLTTIVGLAADLWTKSVAFARLATGEPFRAPGVDGRVHWFVDGRPDLAATDGYPLIPGFLHLRVTVNEGAVFGLGQGHRWLFLVISVAAILFLSYLFATSNGRRFYQFILGLLLAGVLGNMYDRFHHGYVRDMIYGLPRWRVFPWIFNVADVLLCCGVGLIFIYSLVQMRQTAPQRAASPHGSANDLGRQAGG